MSKGTIIAGIDIGTDKICTIIASISHETGNTNVIGVASTPSSGIRKSQIVDLEDAISSITDSVEAAERMAGFNINRAFVSFSGAHIESLNSKGVVAVSEPEGEIVPEDVERVIEAARAVSLANAREIIHVIPRDFVVDSQLGIKDPVGMSGVRLEAEAHLITAPSTAVRNITKCIQELGIQVESLVYAGLASSQSSLTETEKELGVVCIDIGGGTTSVTAFVEGTLAHSSVIPIGAKNVTNDIAIGLRVSLKNAETIKLHVSKAKNQFSPPPGAKASEISKLRKEFDSIDLKKLGIKEDATTTSRKALVEGIIKPRLEELFSMIHDNLSQAEILDKVPAGVVLTGGGAETVLCIQVAKRSLNLPARIGEPQGLSGLVDELTSPVYATATGLIHFGLNQLPQHSGKREDRVLPSLPSVPIKKLIDKVMNLIKSFMP